MTTRRKIIGTDMEMARELSGPMREIARKGFEMRKLKTIGRAQRRDVEVLLIRSSGLVNPGLFETFPNVKLLQSMSAGVDFINIASIPSTVTLCSNAGAYKEPIAEHVFAMLLFFTKNLTRNHERLRNGKFDNSPDSTFLSGKTLGVIGAGGIGQSVARIAKTLNMKTIGINSSGKPAAGFDETWSMKRLDTLLKRSDFVLLSLPLNVHTRNLIDAKKLAVMKDDAILVNVARGPIISQSDLYAHLKTHPNFRVGVDVWWSYPRDGERFSLEFPFFDLPNFISSPHVADGVPESTVHGQERAFENILRYVKRQSLERIIDKSDYKGFTGAHH